MKILFKSATALFAAFCLSSSATAATFTCTSNIQTIDQNDGGGLQVSTSFGTFTFCYVGSTAFNIAAETCKGWMTQLVTAGGLGKQVIFFFDTAHYLNSNMASATCASSNFNGLTRVPYLIRMVF